MESRQGQGEGGIGGYERRWESRTGEEGGRGGKERRVREKCSPERRLGEECMRGG